MFNSRYLSNAARHLIESHAVYKANLKVEYDGSEEVWDRAYYEVACIVGNPESEKAYEEYIEYNYMYWTSESIIYIDGYKCKVWMTGGD